MLQRIDQLNTEVATLKKTQQDAVEKSIAIWQDEEKKRVEEAEARDAGLVKRIRALTRKIAGIVTYSLCAIYVIL